MSAPTTTATAADKLRAALTAHPGTTPELAIAAGIGRSTATTLLAKWETEGSARRTRGPVGKAATWEAVPAPGTSAAETAKDAAEAMGITDLAGRHRPRGLGRTWGGPGHHRRRHGAERRRGRGRTDLRRQRRYRHAGPRPARPGAHLAGLGVPAEIAQALAANAPKPAPACHCGDDAVGHMHPERRAAKAKAEGGKAGKLPARPQRRLQGACRRRGRRG